MFIRNPRKSESVRRAMQVGESSIMSQHCNMNILSPPVVSVRDISHRWSRAGKNVRETTWDRGVSTILNVKLCMGTGEGEIQFFRKRNASARHDSSSREVSTARLRPARRGMGMFLCMTSVCNSSCHTLRSWVIWRKSLQVCL